MAPVYEKKALLPDEAVVRSIMKRVEDAAFKGFVVFEHLSLVPDSQDSLVSKEQICGKTIVPSNVRVMTKGQYFARCLLQRAAPFAEGHIFAKLRALEFPYMPYKTLLDLPYALTLKEPHIEKLAELFGHGDPVLTEELSKLLASPPLMTRRMFEETYFLGKPTHIKNALEVRAARAAEVQAAGIFMESTIQHPKLGVRKLLTALGEQHGYQITANRLHRMLGGGRKIDPQFIRFFRETIMQWSMADPTHCIDMTQFEAQLAILETAALKPRLR